MSNHEDLLEKLYKNYELINKATDKSIHSNEFREILDVAVTGGINEKRLAAQFIPKLFQHFPTLAEAAIDKALDLCEDNDINVRRMAIKELPGFTKVKENVPRISDILSQLLIASDPVELHQVQASLSMILKLDPLATLTGIYNQILQGDESIRLSCLQFVSSKFINAGPEVLTKDCEELIINETKKVLNDVSAEEFQECIKMLSSTKIGKTITGHQEIVKLCIEQANLEEKVDSANDEIIEIFLICASQALPFLSSQIESTAFVKFVCEKFLTPTTWKFIASTDTQLRLLKLFAELTTHCGALDEPKEKIDAIYRILLDHLPTPSDDLEINMPAINFSHVECLLYALHTLGKKCSDVAITLTSNDEKFKDFRKRLLFLSRLTNQNAKKLQEIAPNLTSNIATLVRELYNPNFKAAINLSWVKPKSKFAFKVESVKPNEVPQVATKRRHEPITFESTETPKKMRQHEKFGGRRGGKRGRGGNRFRR